MSQIPLNTQFIGLAATVDTTERRSATINAESAAYTMQDIVDTTRPYKVYTALLTQSGDDNQNVFISSGLLTIGVTYLIDEIIAGTPDFTNVGAPNNNQGTYFVATGTTPNSWGDEVTLVYVAAAPVATVLENTIGNIWFTYQDAGVYVVNSDALFTSNKTIISFMPSIYIESPSDIYNFTGYQGDVNVITLLSTYNYNQANNQFGGYGQTAIEIRVYN